MFPGFRPITVVGCLLMAPLSAQAAVVSGSFAGTVRSGTALGSDPRFPLDLTGSAVTGSFSVDPVAVGTYYEPGSYAVPVGDVVLSYSFAALGRTLSYGTIGGGALFLSDDGTTQDVSLEPDFTAGPFSPTLDLVGPEGSLFTSINDLSSLHAGPGVAISSPILCCNRGSGINATINVNSTTISSPAQPVPEPPGWSVLGVCALALAGIRVPIKTR